MAAENKLIAVELIKLEIAPVAATGFPTTGWEEIDYVHEETFQYNQTETSTDPYRTVKGEVYHTDLTAGDTSIDVVIGNYSLRLKADLEGGTYTPATSTSGATYTPPISPVLVYRAVRATTKDGVIIRFSNGQVIANATNNKKAIGQSIRFIPTRHPDPATPAEDWNDGIPSA